MRHIFLACALAAALGFAAPAADAQKRPRLTEFQSCAGLVNYSRRHADTVVSTSPAMPPPGRPVPAPQQQGGAEQQGGTAPAAQPQATSSPTSDARTGDDFSQTNVQEAGVDEPDIIKSDGRRMFVVRGNRLQVIGVGGDQAPRVLGSVELPPGGDHGLLLRGDRLLVVSRGFVSVPGDPTPQPAQPSPDVVASPAPGFGPAYGTTSLALVDVSDSSAPRITRTLAAEGDFVDARMTGSTVRLVIHNTPRPLRQQDPEVVETARAAQWVPRGMLRRGRQGRRTFLRLADCDDIARPPQFSGLDALTVMTIDVDQGLGPIDTDAVLTRADTVYASKESLYLATQRWTTTSTTLLHKLDISKSDTTTYKGSGEVEGTLLNQFALSEHEGVLRAATTAFGETGQTESYVTTLTGREGRLVQLGRVGGLGRGERIYAVRFIGDQGYVVTFREVDPLYTIDLRNPAAPRVVGELKIAGYSAYLHPIGDNLLIGVGQDATEQGRRTGTQISLFDVANPAQPTRLHQYKPGGFGSSEAEYDHHAFLWWPTTSLVVIPVTGGSESAAVGARVGRGGIAEVGRVKHPVENGFAPVQRSLVVRDRLFTLSPAGLRTSRLDSLADVAWLPLQP